MKPSMDLYDGSRLVILNGDVRACEPCAELKSQLLDVPSFQSQYGEWFARGVLRIGKVNCRKYGELCGRFGVSAVDGEMTPRIIWFKRNKRVGVYDGEPTADGLTRWVQSKQHSGEL